jgi:hypothetical protein
MTRVGVGPSRKGVHQRYTLVTLPCRTTPLRANFVVMADATASWEQHVETERTELAAKVDAALEGGGPLSRLTRSHAHPCRYRTRKKTLMPRYTDFA